MDNNAKVIPDGADDVITVHGSTRRDRKLSRPNSAKQMADIKNIALRHRTAKRSQCCQAIQPDSRMMRQWDVLMFLLIAFTAAVTPFEIAFLETKIDAMFFINRIVDFFFLVDMIINFFLSHYDEVDHMMVQDVRLLAKRYLRGWFVIDLMSILPFDSLALALDLGDGVSNLKVMRLIRLMRLIKLARILRASRIFSRIQATLSWSFSTVALCRFLVMAFVGMHWFACLWKITADLQDPGDSWIFNGESFVADMSIAPAERHVSASVSDLYVASFEFAIMAMSLGYGPTKPTNTVERIVAVMSLLLAGSLYAYIIGAICGVLAMRDPATHEYRENVDTLNQYMNESNLPFQLKVKLRMYFAHCRHQFRNQYYQEVIAKLSPALLGELAEHVYSKWISPITFFRAEDDLERNRFIRTLAINLESRAYAPREVLFHEGDPAAELFIVELGYVGAGPSVFMRGSYFGEEMLLTSGRRRRTAIALVYVDLFSLQREALCEIIRQGNFPETSYKIRRKAIQLKLREMCYRLHAMLSSQPGYVRMTKEEIAKARLKLYSNSRKKKANQVDLERAELAKKHLKSSLDEHRMAAAYAQQRTVERNRRILEFYMEGHKEGFEMDEELQEHLEDEYNSLHFDGGFFDGKEDDVKLMKPMRSMAMRMSKLEGQVSQVTSQVQDIVAMQQAQNEMSAAIFAAVNKDGGAVVPDVMAKTASRKALPPLAARAAKPGIVGTTGGSIPGSARKTRRGSGGRTASFRTAPRRGSLFEATTRGTPRLSPVEPPSSPTAPAAVPASSTGRSLDL